MATYEAILSGSTVFSTKDNSELSRTRVNTIGKVLVLAQ